MVFPGKSLAGAVLVDVAPAFAREQKENRPRGDSNMNACLQALNIGGGTLSLRIRLPL
jgi:hypothetical protein